MCEFLRYVDAGGPTAVDAEGSPAAIAERSCFPNGINGKHGVFTPCKI